MGCDVQALLAPADRTLSFQASIIESLWLRDEATRIQRCKELVYKCSLGRFTPYHLRCSI